MGDLGIDVDVHVLRVGRDGNAGADVRLGAAVLLTSTDPDGLAHDVDVLSSAAWLRAADADVRGALAPR
ncbi:hypothetical protein [Cellulomonas wangsupingiae]|uniref:Uncharacterized protein n=1 Tax=Cellulomonas wangsupingiae TaxID=2968085 RepID=A0ABY5K4E9_9CELL|nr:hypothetical protein [Cellulomonas wangsupingiae]MCC2333955.1 hypothetical protein [Cellulomonas wangsupingiae]UUI65210.1 hypothetical protein NP075_00225 [Cellulomonas wangsupingiae]